MEKNTALDRYLFAVQTLKTKYLCVRSVDVAHYLAVSKAAVSTAVRRLREQGLIEVGTDGDLVFTEQGRRQIEPLNDRVSFFRQKLIDAGIEPALALRDAVSLSVEMSEESCTALRTMLRG